MEKKSNPFVLKDIISDDDSNQNSSQKKKKKKVAFSLNKKKNLENENKNNTERLITDSNRELLPKTVLNDKKNSLNFEIDTKKVVKHNKKQQIKHLKSKSESLSSSIKLLSNSNNSDNNDKKKEIKNEIQKKKLFDPIIEDDNELNINDINKKKNINNDYDKNEYFLKIQTFDFYTLYFTLITFICGIFYHIITYFPNLQGIYTTNKSLYNLSRNFCLIICSTSSLCFILASLNRYIIYLSFDKYSGNVEQKVSFFSFDYFGGFLI